MCIRDSPDYVAKYAHAVNYKGNKHFQNPCSHSYYYVGMTQWLSLIHI